ncbi:MAG: YggT family protein [SAR202 cluster bacterium]|nr:YggT family protein [SAR202 cluster bacterium]
MEFTVRFFEILINILTLAIFGRVIMSWISPRGTDPLSVILNQITEPVLMPIRKVVPRFGMFDLTPMIALLLMQMVLLPIVRSLAY